MKKWILFSVIALSLFGGCSSGKNDQINYQIDRATKEAMVINSPTFNVETLRIPDQILFEGETYRVTSIAVGAFEGNKKIRSLEIPDTVIAVGYDAFRNCGMLERAHLGKGMKTVSDHLFSECRKLKEITGGENINFLNTGAFEKTGLTSLRFDRIASIGIDCFFDCRDLEDIYLDGTYTSIGGSAFESCPKLRSVETASSLTEVGDYAFKNCSSLTDFSFETLDEIGNYAFEKTRIGSVTLEDVSLGQGTFASSALEYLSFKGEEIPYRAFDGCSHLNEIHLSDTVSIGSRAFRSVSVAEMSFPSSLKEISSEAFVDSTISSIAFSLDAHLETISRRAFYRTSLRGELTLPSSLRQIYSEAFASTELASVRIGSSTRLDENCFPKDTVVELY